MRPVMASLVLRPRWSLASPPLPRFLPSTTSPSPSVLFPTPTSTQLSCLHRQPRRYAATSRRTTKALRMKPAPTAAPAMKKRRASPAIQDSIVFNPPPTAPSPYQTPPLFLPPSDPRRTLLAPVHAHQNPYLPTKSASGEDIESDADLPPAFRPPSEKKYHLGAKEIDEIREKRTSNPWVWTRKRLAEEYGCSEYFVSLCAQAIPARQKWHQQNLEAVKARWGPKRQKAREDREKRYKLWQRDE